MPEYAKAISLLNQDKQNLKRQRSLAVQEDYEEDDPRAGRLANLSFWNLPPTYDHDWPEGLTMALSYEEALFLKEQIEITQPNTMLAKILKNELYICPN